MTLVRLGNNHACMMKHSKDESTADHLQRVGRSLKKPELIYTSMYSLFVVTNNDVIVSHALKL
jgi:hypothetical protein